MLVQQALAGDQFSWGNLLKQLWHDGIGLYMLTERLKRSHFISYGCGTAAPLADRSCGRCQDAAA